MYSKGRLSFHNKGFPYIVRGFFLEYGKGFLSIVNIVFNHLLISKILLPIVRGFHELFVFIRKALPSIVRGLFLL